jgi:hypothetical protein
MRGVDSELITRDLNGLPSFSFTSSFTASAARSMAGRLPPVQVIPRPQKLTDALIADRNRDDNATRRDVVSSGHAVTSSSTTPGVAT